MSPIGFFVFFLAYVAEAMAEAPNVPPQDQVQAPQVQPVQDAGQPADQPAAQEPEIFIFFIPFPSLPLYSFSLLLCHVGGTLCGYSGTLVYCLAFLACYT